MGVMTASVFLTFVYALFKSYEPVKGLGSVYQQFELAFGATATVFEYVARPGRAGSRAGVERAPSLFAEKRGIRSRKLWIRSEIAYPARHFLRRAGRRGHRDCWVERSGQDHAGESLAAIFTL